LSRNGAFLPHTDSCARECCCWFSKMHITALCGMIDIMSKTADLPNDVEALKSRDLERSTALEVAEARLFSQKLEL
jgi:hypothetical protein